MQNRETKAGKCQIRQNPPKILKIPDFCLKSRIYIWISYINKLLWIILQKINLRDIGRQIFYWWSSSLLGTNSPSLFENSPAASVMLMFRTHEFTSFSTNCNVLKSILCDIEYIAKRRLMYHNKINQNPSHSTKTALKPILIPIGLNVLSTRPRPSNCRLRHSLKGL